jgi:hypothetical protein
MMNGKNGDQPSVTDANPSNLEPQAEIVLLQEELKARDQLIQQLSEELFRLIKDSSHFTDEADNQALPEESLWSSQASNHSSHSQDLDDIKQQPAAARQHDELAAKDHEIFQLRQITHELKDRCQVLERVIQEFPQVYRRKFAERIQLVQEKVTLLQQENRCLRSDLKIANYRLAVQARVTDGLDLPSFPKLRSAKFSED